MKSEIAVFSNQEFGEVRTVEIKGKVYFVATDIAKALNYSRPNDAINDHCPHTAKHRIGVQTGTKKDGTPATQTVDMNVIPEGDVYRLIVHSKLPAAEKFESWIFDEILPTIRKTGGYVENSDLFVDTYLPETDDATKALFKTALTVMCNQNKTIQEKNETINELLNEGSSSKASKNKKIPVPNRLIDDKGISPKATYLYVMLRDISSFSTGYVEVGTKKLMKRLNWSDNRTLKKYCEILKTEGFLNYDYDAFPKFKPLEFTITVQKNNFEFIDSDILNKLLEIKDVEVDTLIRLYLLYKQYQNKTYKYCWLSYSDIIQRIPISYTTVKRINDLLVKHHLLKIEKGGAYVDDEGLYKKERNKYIIQSMN